MTIYHNRQGNHHDPGKQQSPGEPVLLKQSKDKPDGSPSGEKIIKGESSGSVQPKRQHVLKNFS